MSCLSKGIPFDVDGPFPACSWASVGWSEVLRPCSSASYYVLPDTHSLSYQIRNFGCRTWEFAFRQLPSDFFKVESHCPSPLYLLAPSVFQT